MRRFLCAMIVTAALGLGATPAIAEKRVALLIGNKDYALNKLDLKNPHNDIVHVAAALKKVGFEVTTVKDAGLGKLQIALRRYTRELRKAGAGAIGFLYYSGHGALNEDTRTNYLIPVDVRNIDSEELWDSSLRLRRVIDELKSQAGNAQHFVVFDACRNSLQLVSKTSKSLLQSKGFKAEREVRGMLISYATAEGKIASDVGDNVGPYARIAAGIEQSIIREDQGYIRNVQNPFDICGVPDPLVWNQSDPLRNLSARWDWSFFAYAPEYRGLHQTSSKQDQYHFRNSRIFL